MRWDAGIALLCPRAGDVVCAQYRHRDRRADPPASCAICSEAASASVASFVITIVFVVLVAPIMWVEPHTVPRAPSASAAPSSGARRRATITRCRGRSPCEQFWPQTLIGLVPLLVLAAHRAVGHSLCLLHRRRSAALDSARGGDRRAGAWARADRGRARSTCRRRPCRRRNCARWNCPRSRSSRRKAAGYERAHHGGSDWSR